MVVDWEDGRAGVWSRNLLTGEENWNSNLFSLLGKNPNGSGVAKEPFLEYVHPDDASRASRHFAETSKSGDGYLDEFRIIRDGGEIRWLASFLRLDRNREGKPERLVGLNYDITERKLEEESLQESETLYRTLFDTIDEGFCIVEIIFNESEEPIDLRFLKSNPVFLKESGAADIENKRILEMSPKFDKDWFSIFARIAKNGKPVIYEKDWFEIYGRFAQNSDPAMFEHYSRQLHRWFEVYAFRIGESRFHRVAVIIKDITTRREMEERSRKLRDDLKLQIQLRTAEYAERTSLLARLTSELTLAEQRERRRIAEILHDHIQQLMVSAKIRQDLLIMNAGEELKDQAEFVLDLINQSIQATHSLTAELSPRVLRSGDLVASIKWLARRVGETQGTEVIVQCENKIMLERKDLTVLLFQSVRELLLNVAKHSGVQSAMVKINHGDDNLLRISVVDRGKGFDSNEIWEKAKKGTGFGLFTIRERIMLLGGCMEIESSPGNGASFSLVLPVKNVGSEDNKLIKKKSAVPQRSKKSGEAIRILIADDHAVVRQGFSTMLGMQPDIHVISEASDGESAVRMAREYDPDVILMDFQMPKLNGLEATRIIHAESPHIRIIGLSMYDADEISAMIEAGASAVLSKEVNMEFLFNEIRGKVK